MTHTSYQALSLEMQISEGVGDAGLEADLVRRARTNPDAFATLYRRHYPAIARYIRRRVGDEHLAGDLVAETFLTALEALPRYRERGLPFRAWLYRLASSRVNRWARRLPQSRMRAFEEEEHGVCHTESGGESAGLERIEIVRRALLSLPVRYQTALALHYLEGLSVAEIARTLGSRAGTIKARLARGRERLRRKLEPHTRELQQ